MKKYTPSVKNDNAVKEELCSEMKGLLYRIEKGKYDRRLDRDGVRGDLFHRSGISCPQREGGKACRRRASRKAEKSGIYTLARNTGRS